MLYKDKKEAYEAYRSNPDKFFEQYHEKYFNERELISPDWTWYETKYHYNMVENGIIDLLRSSGIQIEGQKVLDVGSGTGHWVEFYHYYLQASFVQGVDFSEVAAQKLGEKFSAIGDIDIQQGDITQHHPEWQGQFGIVNAIGVIFHIVDDNLWEQAVSNMCSYLKPGGVAIIGGEFGDTTEELGVMRKVRSLDRWKEEIDKVNAKYCDKVIFEWFKNEDRRGLKNNLLMFQKP